MTIRIFCLCLGLLFATGALANAQTRMVMYTIQNRGVFIFVAVIDESPAPRGVISRTDSARRGRFTVSRQEFEQIWRTLQSDAAQRYAGRAGVNREFDAFNNYVFSAAYMPTGKKTTFVVPKGGPKSLVSLAQQFEGYARR